MGKLWGSMSDQVMRERLFETGEAAVKRGVAPGLVALVNCDGAELYYEAHGRKASVARGGEAGDWVNAPLQRDDVFDLASLTKVLCTTILAAQLVQDGAWGLDQPLPAPCDRPLETTTLAELLAHCSGLTAHVPYYVDYAWPSEESRESILHRVLQAPVAYPPRSQAVYSDLGFILLGTAIEWHYGQRLDQVFENRIARPLGLDRNDEHWVGFLPLDTPSKSLPEGLEPRVLPTECYEDPEGERSPIGDYHKLRYRWSGQERWARGQVHDDNCYCLLGVAGHAGLFGTARGVAQIASAWLDGDALGIDIALRKRFESKCNLAQVAHTRGLGWDGVGSESPLERGAFCHLGYTGTGLWIERGPANAIYVLLSHRVHTGRQNAEGIRELRKQFCAHAKNCTRNRNQSR